MKAEAFLATLLFSFAYVAVLLLFSRKQNDYNEDLGKLLWL